MPNHSRCGLQTRLRGLRVTLALAGIIIAIGCGISSAQTDNPAVIKVESREVILPIEVVQEKKSTGVVPGPDGRAQLGWVLHFKEIAGLSAKSVHIFDDGVEVKIQHFSVEKEEGWIVRDNV